MSLSRLSSTVSAAEATVLVQADRNDVAGRAGSTSTATWLAQSTGLTRGAAHARVRLAKALDERPMTASALGEGRVVVEQARVIVDAVEAVEQVPTDLAEQRGLDVAGLADAAEQRLLAEAAHHDAKALRVLGRHVLDVIAPEVAEEHERRLLEAEERRAGELTRLMISEDGHGLVHGRFTIPALHGAMLRKALRALAAPKHLAASGTAGSVPGRPSAQRLGAAFCEYVERYPAHRLPEAGGVSATVVVTIGIDQLRSALGAGVLDDHGRISATEARRLACEAGIVPAVLGARVRSSTSDDVVGSTPSRNASRSRCAMVVARPMAVTGHLGCATRTTMSPGPAAARRRSSTGACSVRGTTLAHDPAYLTTRLGTGKLRFTRRT